MRLQHYSSFFRPEEFDAMTAAYDAAWQHLQTNRPTLTADQVRVLKKNLAQSFCRLPAPENGTWSG
jgi:hypothetical protein